MESLMSEDQASCVDALSVLIIEDSDDVRYLVAAIVDRDPGVEVVGEAHNAAAGLAAAATHQPAVIVLDVGLPDRSGLDIIPELRRLVPAARIIVLSGDHRPELNAEIVARGAHAYVAKRDASSRLMSVLQSLQAAAR
jgi:DNA-binding NarL/FixJ family response regulator